MSNNRRSRWEQVSQSTDLWTEPVAFRVLPNGNEAGMWPLTSTWRHVASGFLVTVALDVDAIRARYVVKSVGFEAPDGQHVSLRQIKELKYDEIVRLTKDLASAFGGSPEEWTSRDLAALRGEGLNPAAGRSWKPADLRKVATVYRNAQPGASTRRAVAAAMQCSPAMAGQLVSYARHRNDPRTGEPYLERAGGTTRPQRTSIARPSRA